MAVFYRESKTVVNSITAFSRESRTSLDFVFHRESKTQVSRIEIKTRESRTSLYTAQYSSQVVSPQVADFNPVTTPARVIECSISGQSLLPYLKTVSMSRVYGGKISCSIVFSGNYSGNFVANTNNLVPPGYGSFSGLIAAHDRTKTRELKLTISRFSEERTFLLYPREPNWNAESMTLSWSFECLQGLAEENQHEMEDISWDTGDRYSVVSAFSEMSSIANVPVFYEGTDFLIGRIDRGKVSILKICDELAARTKSRRVTIDNKVLYRQKKLSSPKKIYNGKLDIRSGSSFYSLPAPKNKWTFSRLDPIGSVIGESKPSPSGGLLGFNTIQFSPPSNAVRIEKVFVRFGDLINWTYFNSAGTPLNVDAGTTYFQSAQKIASARFTYQNTPGVGVFTPEFHIVAYGGQRPSFGAYNQSESSSSLQAIHGIQEEGEIQSAIILDSSGLAASASAYKNDSELSVYGLTFSTYNFDIFLDPTDTIRVTSQRNRLSSVDFHVDEIQDFIDVQNGISYQDIKASRGLL